MRVVRHLFNEDINIDINMDTMTLLSTNGTQFINGGSIQRSILLNYNRNISHNNRKSLFIT